MGSQSQRTPQSGDVLILSDERRFLLTSTTTGSPGWWFKAMDEARSCTLEGNLLLRWDESAGAWRPAPLDPGPSQRISALDRRRQSRTKQSQ